MADEIEVNIDEKKDSDVPVSFMESDGDTMVTVGEEKKEERADDDRWRRAEANSERLSQQLDELRSRALGTPVQQSYPGAPQADPWKSEEDSIYQQERALGIQWESHRRSGTLSPDLIEQYDQKARELNAKKVDIATRRSMASMVPQIIQATQEQHYRQEYADVRGNPAATRWARGHYDMLVAQGAPESPETVKLAMNAARTQFRIGNYRAQPTEQDRQQLTGFSGNNRRNMEPKNNVVKMGKAEKSMAMAMYGDRFNGDEKKAYAQWAKGPGIRAQKAMQKGRRAASGG